MEEAVLPDQSSKKSRNTRLGVIAGAVLVLLLVAIGVWYIQVKAPHDRAVAAFNDAMTGYGAAVDGLAARTGDLDSAIADLQGVIDSDAQPLDRELLTSAGKTIGEAQGGRVEAPAAPEIPESTADIEKLASELPALTADVERLGDYGAAIAKLGDAKTALENSIKQMQQVTNPAEAFVIERIKDLPTVKGVQAVTEDNDPNGKLNKQGGYTATVFLASEQVNQASVAGNGIVGKGTDGGGSVEVYRTVAEAEARDTYLGAFDGTVFAPGSHKVLGTVLIRTSDKLTATQQAALEKAIWDALTELR